MSNYRQQFSALIDKALPPQERAKLLADVARQKRDELIRSGQASTLYRTTVDGRKGASESSVRGDGKGVINYRFSNLADAAEFALSYLRTRVGPYQDFARFFWVSVDGRYIPPGQFNPSFVKPGQEIIIGNTEPWNRRLDVQLIGNRKLSYNVAPGMYDDCARAVRRQFGKSISADRKYDYGFPQKYRAVKTARFQSPVLIIKEA